MLPHWAESEAADMAACRATLRTGSRSFAAAARLLPRRVRDPAVALYAFCRAADDVVDCGEGGRDGLAWLHERLALVYAGRPMDLAADRAFARVVERFAIPRAVPEGLLEGFAWDAQGHRYCDLAALRAYAVRVAGTVGAMMAVLMGVRDPVRLARAIDLGVAMQLFNIARDVGEDARLGRLYLPTQWLVEAGIEPDRFLARPQHSPALAAVIRRLLDVADDHVRSAQAGIARLPASCRLGIGAASLLYAEIGAEVARRGHDAVSARAVVSGRRKAWVLARGLAGTALPWREADRPAMREAAWLVDAVACRPEAEEPPWWDLAGQLRAFVELLEKLEQRENRKALLRS